MENATDPGLHTALGVMRQSLGSGTYMSHPAVIPHFLRGFNIVEIFELDPASCANTRPMRRIALKMTFGDFAVDPGQDLISF
jgi:hypothetical protein